MIFCDLREPIGVRNHHRSLFIKVSITKPGVDRAGRKRTGLERRGSFSVSKGTGCYQQAQAYIPLSDKRL